MIRLVAVNAETKRAYEVSATSPLKEHSKRRKYNSKTAQRATSTQDHPSHITRITYII